MKQVMWDIIPPDVWMQMQGWVKAEFKNNFYFYHPRKEGVIEIWANGNPKDRKIIIGKL